MDHFESTTPHDQGTSPAPPSLSPDNSATLQPPKTGETIREPDQGQDAGIPPPELAKQPHILDRFLTVIRKCGVVGEDRAVQLIFLVMISRFLERMVSAVLKGPSSGGKSFVLSTTLRFFPERSYYALTAMSEKVLPYLQEPMSHRFLVLYEAAGMTGRFATYLLRSLLSEGCIRYQTMQQIKGKWQPELEELEGPTGLLISTTAIKLHPENETRLLSILISDTPEQTRRVLERQAEGWIDQPDLSEWLDLQRWLEKAEHRVVIPYAKALAQAIPPDAVRLRRDFPALLNLVKAHAILHQTTRDKDFEGQIIATLEDYAMIRGLIGDILAEGVGLSVPQTVRETVGAVRTVLAKKSIGKHATNMEVAAELRIDKSSSWRRIRTAISLGYLVNEEHRRCKPHRLVMGEPLPEDKMLLPQPEDLDGCTVAAEIEEGRGHE